MRDIDEECGKALPDVLPTAVAGSGCSCLLYPGAVLCLESPYCERSVRGLCHICSLLTGSDFFVPSVALAEIILRGSLIYLGIFALMRFVLKREAGTIGLPDLPDDGAHRRRRPERHGGRVSFDHGRLPADHHHCVLELYAGLARPALPRMARLLHPPPLPLVKDGRLLHRNMRRELITEEELRSHLRQQGIAEFAQVQAAYMEGDGQISIIPREDRVK